VYVSEGEDPELELFGWGFLAGSLVTIAAGGVLLYFGWPYLVGALRAIPVFKEMVEEAKRRGLLG